MVLVGLCLDPHHGSQPIYNGKPILTSEAESTDPREQPHLRFKNTDFISKNFTTFLVQKQLSSWISYMLFKNFNSSLIHCFNLVFFPLNIILSIFIFFSRENKIKHPILSPESWRSRLGPFLTSGPKHSQVPCPCWETPWYPHRLDSKAAVDLCSIIHQK